MGGVQYYRKHISVRDGPTRDDCQGQCHSYERQHTTRKRDNSVKRGKPDSRHNQNQHIQHLRWKREILRLEFPLAMERVLACSTDGSILNRFLEYEIVKRFA